MRRCLETVGRGFLRVTLRLEKAAGLLEAVLGLLRIFPTLRRLYGLMGTNGGSIRDEQRQVGAS